ncbi:putative Glycosyl hydrolase family 35 protein [Hibiscus syriacus]|uniref:Glycosyl hydrolase family 35 protein n=1 Tax=Hibiscus syriacus TaxID=106335 RepID=A0A6A3BJP0_HIBSY|nr:QWRF motif-containing protein 2-like [Hibiscus syriacus]KAE8715648.1 putative Glycosyl hydrolase family 35 protein [Hibiscus syriacus]
MVATVSAAVNPKQRGGGPQPYGQHQNPSRPPLLPSDPDNAIAPRRHKFREVTSRYLSTPSSSNSSMSSSSSSAASTKRCPSPFVSKSTTPSTIKRSQSVERRQVTTPRPNNSMNLRNSDGNNNGELSAVQKLLFTSTRSLSVSFQGDSFSYQFTKAKPAPSPGAARKGAPEKRKPTPITPTPDRGIDQTGNSYMERLPAGFRKLNSMSRIVDGADEKRRLNGSVNGNVVRALQNAMIDTRDSTCVTAVGSEAQFDSVASDTESVSAGSAGAPESSSNGYEDVKRGPRGIIVPARFLQEANSRLRRAGPLSPVSKKITTHSKIHAPDKFGIDSPSSSPKGVVNSRGQLSPIRGSVRPASPSKLGVSSPARGMSPSRVRNGSACNLVNTPSILSFAGDVLKMGKIGENKVSDSHLLRLLHNRLLQWRFTNASAYAAVSSQTSNAEKNLYSTWITTSKLQESVRAKRTELQLLRKKLKLISILKGQMMLLDEWDVLDHDYCSSLSAATEALMASTLRLPIVAGARADVPNLKDVICSAVDIMQGISSSMCSLFSKVAEVKSLVGELGNASGNEIALLEHCQVLVSTISAMQVKECSLRTHILQLNQLPSSMTTELYSSCDCHCLSSNN